MNSLFAVLYVIILATLVLTNRDFLIELSSKLKGLTNLLVLSNAFMIVWVIIPFTILGVMNLFTLMTFVIAMTGASLFAAILFNTIPGEKEE